MKAWTSSVSVDRRTEDCRRRLEAELRCIAEAWAEAAQRGVTGYQERAAERRRKRTRSNLEEGQPQKGQAETTGRMEEDTTATSSSSSSSSAARALSSKISNRAPRTGSSKERGVPNETQTKQTKRRR